MSIENNSCSLKLKFGHYVVFKFSNFIYEVFTTLNLHSITNSFSQHWLKVADTSNSVWKCLANIMQKSLSIAVAAGWLTLCWKWVKTQQRTKVGFVFWHNQLHKHHTVPFCFLLRTHRKRVSCLLLREKKREPFSVTLFSRRQTEITQFLAFSLSNSPSSLNRKKQKCFKEGVGDSMSVWLALSSIFAAISQWPLLFSHFCSYYGKL